MRIGRAQLGILALAVAALTRVATGDEAQAYRWSWVRLPGTETCPSAERMAAGVRARLRRDPFLDRAARDIQATVTQLANGWRADLSVIGEDGRVLGSRRLESVGQDCSALAEAVTLAVALTIDPQASLMVPEPAPPPAAVATQLAPLVPVPIEPPPTVRASPATPPKAALLERIGRRRNELFDVSASLRAMLVFGVLPRAGFGAESAAALGLSSHVQLSAGVGFLPEVRTADGGYGFGLSAAALGLCLVAADAKRFKLRFCAEGQLGAMHVAVYAADALPPGDHLLAAARAGPRFSVRLGGPVSLELGALLVIPLVRRQFVLRGATEPVFQSNAVGSAVTLGLHLSIP